MTRLSLAAFAAIADVCDALAIRDAIAADHPETT